jgi:hypothetical protein
MRYSIFPVIHMSAPAEPGEICEDFPSFGAETWGMAVAPSPYRKPPENTFQDVTEFERLEPLKTKLSITEFAQPGFSGQSGYLPHPQTQREKNVWLSSEEVFAHLEEETNRGVGGMPRQAENGLSYNSGPISKGDLDYQPRKDPSDGMSYKPGPVSKGDLEYQPFVDPSGELCAILHLLGFKDGSVKEVPVPSRRQPEWVHSKSESAADDDGPQLGTRSNPGCSKHGVTEAAAEDDVEKGTDREAVGDYDWECFVNNSTLTRQLLRPIRDPQPPWNDVSGQPGAHTATESSQELLSLPTSGESNAFACVVDFDSATLVAAVFGPLKLLISNHVVVLVNGLVC